jgi:50S ribosomal protein L16 3-hydroxylase
MLPEWLAPVRLEEFTTHVLHRRAYARPGSASGALPLFDWPTLDGLLAARPPPDLLVVTRGRVLDEPPPRCLAALRGLMHRGLGLNIRRAERSDRGLSRLASAFGSTMGAEVQIQLFVTPAETYGFGWHYDAEDVFIVQTAGTKDYYFRENTVSSRVCSGPPDFSQVRDETSPLQTARLIPGDWLYIPSRWWHIARCVEDSLSISVGVGLQRG